MTTGRIGMVGLGQMGRGQARNLMAAGFEVRGHDIDTAATAGFRADGGTVVGSAAEAAADAELFIVLVFSAAQAQDVLFGPDGAVGALPRGVGVVLHTTGAPDQAAALAQRLAAAGHPMLDCPITGGKAGADAGTLTAIASGPEAAFVTAEPALRAMCARIVRIGDAAGQASTVKMINQLLVGVHAAATAEALHLAARAGADLDRVIEVILNGQGYSRMFERIAPAILARDFEARGALSIMTKDLGIVAGEAARLGAATPLAAAAAELFAQASAQGHARDDVASVFAAFAPDDGDSRP